MHIALLTNCQVSFRNTKTCKINKNKKYSKMQIRKRVLNERIEEDRSKIYLDLNDL
jgi:hypothetical protein